MTMAVVAIITVAAAATLGDFIWYTFGVRHSLVAGLVHGVLLLATVGAVLGLACGRVVRGLPIGAMAGIGGALTYYALILVWDSRTYGPAIPGAWVMMWLLLAALDGRWLRAPQRRRWREVAVRGILAAVLGGVTFALIRSRLWGRPAGVDRNYLLQFVTWAVAWAPGLLALTWSGAGRGGRTAEIAPAELLARIDRGERPAILDVRRPVEFAAGHVPGAVNIPFTAIGEQAAAVPGAPDDELVVYCGHGPRAYIAATALRAQGRARITFVAGHFDAWRRAGLRSERGDS